jgi:hypothetical protein
VEKARQAGSLRKKESQAGGRETLGSRFFVLKETEKEKTRGDWRRKVLLQGTIGRKPERWKAQESSWLSLGSKPI